MKTKFSTDAKIGLFILAVFAMIAYLTIEVSNLSLSPGGTYTVYMKLKSAEGLTTKTPVQIAGIPIGVVDDIELIENNEAKLKLKIQKGVKLSKNMQAQLKTRGILGDSYLELIPGPEGDPLLEKGEFLQPATRPMDYEGAIADVSEITADLKEITEILKTNLQTDRETLSRVLNNMDELTANLAQITLNNQKNIHTVLYNMASMTADLRNVVSRSSPDFENSLANLDEMTTRINEGKGTIGQLMNDDSTIEKTNEILDQIGDLTGQVHRLQTEIGYRLEYLGGSNTAKNYMTLKLKPRPDRYFQFDVVYNPNPPATTRERTFEIDVNGQSNVVELTESEFKELRFSAQIAKQFKDFTVRGGLIESTGGFGVDYTKGPAQVRLDMYDFGGNDGPNLKATAQLNVTKSLFVLGGADDMLGLNQGFDWFLGAGIRFTDEDIRGLVSGAGLLLSQ